MDHAFAHPALMLRIAACIADVTCACFHVDERDEEYEKVIETGGTTLSSETVELWHDFLVPLTDVGLGAVHESDTILYMTQEITSPGSPHG